MVEALVRRAAVAGGSTVDEDFDTEAWWDAHGDGDALGYSNLLESLASTSASRRALLAGFFETTEEEREAGLKIPNPAHHTIAALVKRGLVRVIVTTNFDRLLERAIEATGVSPQVISSEAAIAGMEPLQHVPCTILKLHGDYAPLINATPSTS
ncbi:SIR2 family protein [Agromyces laixinhei]|uniref:SIR2 family protein n=1 Tax=Agromyces laixinhei TaxID=2585717 RepID=UPI00143CE16A|nr:SIR2 family protein [Agromyces laixinhei]